MTLKMKTQKTAAVLMAALVLASPVAAAGNSPAQHGKINTQRLSYDWLRSADVTRVASAMTPSERKVLAARSARFGNGAWVCSPAGSGQRSQCYAR